MADKSVRLSRRDADGDGNFANAVVVASSTSATSAEDVTLPLPPAGSYAVAVVGWKTAVGGTVYDLSTWLVNDASPDDPSNAPGIAVTGDGAVTAGTPKTLALAWSGVDAPGTYLGVVTYHATDAPTASNIAAYSLVELTRTGATPSGGAASGGDVPSGGDTGSGGDAPSGGAGTPSGASPTPAVRGSSGGAAPAATALTVRSASLRGRTLTLTVRGTTAGTLRASVKQGRRFVAKAAGRRVTGRTVRLTLDRRLRRGTYTVKVIAGAKTVGSVRLRQR